MSDKGRHFRLKPGIEIEAYDVCPGPGRLEDAVRFQTSSGSSQLFYIPLSFLEEFDPPRAEPKAYKSAEIDTDGHVWQRGLYERWGCTYGSVGNANYREITWEALQERYGPTKPLELPQ